MRITKKAVSLVLAMLMITSLFTIVPMTVNAAPPDSGTGTGTGGSTTVITPTTAGDDYLTFTAEEANSSVTLEYRSCDYLQYNKNNSGWQDYSYGAQITLANVGDYVRFRGSGTSFNDYHHVSLTGKVAASGSVMSLRLDNDGNSQGLSNSCFQYMFDYCDGLTTAPELPETLLARNCYFSMFRACTSLTKAPALPATTLAKNCYSYMFRECTNLTELPALPATTLADSCYYYMFYDCPKIRISDQAVTFDEITYSVPYRIPSEGIATDAENALYRMFLNTGGKFTGTPNINTTYYLPAPAHEHTWDTSNITWTATYDGSDATLTAHVPCTGCDDVEDFEGTVGMFGVEEAGYSNCSEEAYDTVSGYVTIGGTNYYSGPIVANTYPVDPTAHPYELTHYPATAATYNSEGNTEYWYCGACEKYFSDEEGTQEIAENSWVIPMLTGAVASVNGVKYGTFAEAVAGRANNDDVIELLAAAGSYTMTAGQSIKVIKNSKSLTLNAPAGAYAVANTYDSTTKVYTYTAIEAVASATKNDTTTYYASANEALRDAATGSTITLLKDSTEAAISRVGSKTSGKTYTIDLNNKTLTLNGSGNALFNIASPSNVTIQNGTIVFDGTGTNQNGILLNDVYNTAVLTIEDDVVIEATGTCSAITVTGGTLNTEGTLSSENAPAIDTTNNSSATDYTINVTGGSVTSTGDTAICQRVATGELNITGGNISGDTAAVQAINNTDDTVTVSGGTFNTPVPEEYCADGYIPEDNGDNTYGVKVGSYVAQVGSTKYESITAARTAALDTENPVVLLKDTTYNGRMSIKGDVTFDLNGFELESTGSKGLFIISEGGSLTVKNGTISATAPQVVYNTDGTFVLEDDAIVKNNSSGSGLGYYSKNATADAEISGTIQAYNGIQLDDSATATIKDGAVIDATLAGIVLFSASQDLSTPGGSVEIEGGTITGRDGIVVGDGGSVAITGGEVTATNNLVRVLDTPTPSTVEIYGGLFNKVVPEEYAAPGFVPSEQNPVTGKYTVEVDNSNPLNPLNVAAKAINDGNAFGLKTDYLMGTLIGVQNKAVVPYSTSSQEGEKNMRFVACLDTDILQSAEDYGFVIAKVDDEKDYSNTKIENLKAFWGNGEKTLSAKGTYNNVCGTAAYGDPTDNTTDYKYITCAVNNVSDSDKLLARFYVKINGKYYYAKYSGHDYKYTGCIASWADLG